MMLVDLLALCMAVCIVYVIIKFVKYESKGTKKSGNPVFYKYLDYGMIPAFFILIGGGYISAMEGIYWVQKAMLSGPDTIYMFSPNGFLGLVVTLGSMFFGAYLFGLYGLVIELLFPEYEFQKFRPRKPSKNPLGNTTTRRFMPWFTACLLLYSPLVLLSINDYVRVDESGITTSSFTFSKENHEWSDIKNSRLDYKVYKGDDGRLRLNPVLTVYTKDAKGIILWDEVGLGPPDRAGVVKVLKKIRQEGVPLDAEQLDEQAQSILSSYNEEYQNSIRGIFDEACNTS